VAADVAADLERVKPDSIVGEPEARDSRRRTIRSIPGGLVAVTVVGAGLLVVAWCFGQFVYAPVFCGGPSCGPARAALTVSLIIALVGIGCVVLDAVIIQIPPTPLLIAAMGAFVAAALVCLQAKLVLMPLIDIVLMIVPIGLFLALGEPSRRTTDGPTARKASYAYWGYWLTMALFSLTWLATLFVTLAVATFRR
jgi:hypothetical protein